MTSFRIRIPPPVLVYFTFHGCSSRCLPLCPTGMEEQELEGAVPTLAWGSGQMTKVLEILSHLPYMEQTKYVQRIADTWRRAEAWAVQVSCGERSVCPVVQCLRVHALPTNCPTSFFGAVFLNKSSMFIFSHYIWAPGTTMGPGTWEHGVFSEGFSPNSDVVLQTQICDWRHLFHKRSCAGAHSSLLVAIYCMVGRSYKADLTVGSGPLGTSLKTLQPGLAFCLLSASWLDALFLTQ